MAVRRDLKHDHTARHHAGLEKELIAGTDRPPGIDAAIETGLAQTLAPHGHCGGQIFKG